MNTKPFVITTVLLLMLLGSLTSNAQQDGKTIYEGRCASCHKISNQDLVGPGLANVNKRRDEEYLIKFIRNSQKLINSGNELAKKVYNEYNQTIMPSHEDLSDEEILNVLDYIKQESKGIAEEKVISEQEEASSDNKEARFPKFSTLPPDEKEKDYKYNPDSTDFRIFFWLTSIIAVLLVLGFTLIVIKFSN